MTPPNILTDLLARAGGNRPRAWAMLAADPGALANLARSTPLESEPTLRSVQATPAADALRAERLRVAEQRRAERLAFVLEHHPAEPSNTVPVRDLPRHVELDDEPTAPATPWTYARTLNDLGRGAAGAPFDRDADRVRRVLAEQYRLSGEKLEIYTAAQMKALRSMKISVEDFIRSQLK